MDFERYLSFLGNSLLFNISIVLIGFVLGWIMYSRIILRKINLRDALFEKDNVAAWIEFFGAFIFPTLYLSAKLIEGAADTNIFMDLAICIGYEVGFIIIFTVLRLFSNMAIRQISPPDAEGKINLNNEIYKQKNIAAALFSIALSTMFLNLIRFFDVMPENISTSLLTMSSVLIYTLISIIVFSIILRSKTTLFKEIFIDNNPAAGIVFTGFILAVETILANLIELQPEFDFIDMMVFPALALFIFGIMSVIFKWLFAKMVKADVWSEVYEQNSIGAAIGQVALYMGIANIIIHFVK